MRVVVAACAVMHNVALVYNPVETAENKARHINRRHSGGEMREVPGNGYTGIKTSRQKGVSSAPDWFCEKISRTASRALKIF